MPDLLMRNDIAGILATTRSGARHRSRATPERCRAAWAVGSGQRRSIELLTKILSLELRSHQARQESTGSSPGRFFKRELIPLRLLKVQHLQHDVRPFPPAAAAAARGAARRPSRELFPPRRQEERRLRARLLVSWLFVVFSNNIIQKIKCTPSSSRHRLVAHRVRRLRPRSAYLDLRLRQTGLL